MEIKKDGTINLVAIFIIVVFTIMSFFTCFEIHFTSRIAIDGINESTTIDTITNNIVPVVALGFLQILFLILKKRSMLVASIICAGLSIVVTIRELLKAFVESAFDSMGGLGYAELKITVVGYIVILLSFLNFIIQIISSKKKEGNDQ